MGAIEFRNAIPSDAPALGALHVASWRETYAGILPDEMLANLSVDARTMMWSNILDDPAAFGGAKLYITEDQDRLIGFGSCSRQRDEALATSGFTAEIGAIYILRSHQGLSVGRSIMAMMAQALLEDEHRAANLWVLRENAAARGFYERLGGEVIGEKQEEQAEATLVEIAYGWRDLSHLAC